MPDSYMCLWCGAMQGTKRKCLLCGGPVKDYEQVSDADLEKLKEIRGER